MSEDDLPGAKLSASQSELWSQILASSLAVHSDRVVLVCEYLRYLPFGLYQWLECAGQDISSRRSSAWQQADLVAIEAAGCLVLVEAWQNPDDGLETKTMYRICREAESEFGFDAGNRHR